MKNIRALFLVAILSLFVLVSSSAEAEVLGRVENLWDYHNRAPLKKTEDRLGLGAVLTAQVENSPEGKTRPAFPLTDAEFIGTGQFAEGWRAFIVYDFQNSTAFQNPDMAGRSYGTITSSATAEMGWFEYAPIPTHVLRLGRILTPFGIVNREHFFSTILGARQPLLLNSGYFTTTISGFEINGEPLDGLTYHLYIGSASYDRAPIVEGGRMSYRFPFEGEWTLGANFQRGPTGAVAPRYDAFGPDLAVSWRQLGLKSEYMQTSFRQRGYYFEPSCGLGKLWRVFYRLDSISNDVRITTNADSVKHIIGFNYFLGGNEHRRLKFEIDRTAYRIKLDTDGANKDYTLFVAQVAFEF